MTGFLDPYLKDDERAVLDRARGFGQRVMRPNADHWERGMSVIEGMHAAAHEGLLRLEVPHSLGGLGHRYLLKLAMTEALSRIDMAFTFAMINTQNVAARLSYSKTRAHLETLVPALTRGDLFGATALSEPNAGSDFAGIKTSATKVDGGWVLNGEKGWITNATIADLFITYVQTDPSAGWRGIACFLVDGRKAGFTRVAPYDIFGGRAIGVGGFKLDNYFAGEDDLLAPAGEAFKLAMQGVNGARVYVAAMCAGLLAASLETAVDYGAERQAFGKALIKHQGLAWSLSDVATDLTALRALTRDAGLLIDAQKDAVMAAAQAKSFSGRVSVAGVTACIQAMGAAGLRTEHGLGRHLSAAKIAAFTDGSSEMMSERIAAGLTASFGSTRS
ncbi:MAG: acyl-CoA dehydrogenase family protein [Parvibaculum sp.]|nr:acyl-CoA dehydrogenase family protein [Parvibaculum sp.]